MAKGGGGRNRAVDQLGALLPSFSFQASPQAQAQPLSLLSYFPTLVQHSAVHSRGS